MYNVHALEKGLARTGDLRLGFGVKALSNLNDALVVYRTKGYDETAFAYIEGVSIIQRYKELHTKEQFDVGFLDDIFDPVFLDPQVNSGAAGTKIVRKVDKERNYDKSFYELAQGRSSVREFSGEPIDHSKVMNAIRNAERTPSVCNRQGWKRLLGRGSGSRSPGPQAPARVRLSPDARGAAHDHGLQQHVSEPG